MAAMEASQTELLGAAGRAAEEVGRMVIAHQRRLDSVRVERKGEGDFVTNIDGTSNFSAGLTPFAVPVARPRCTPRPGRSTISRATATTLRLADPHPAQGSLLNLLAEIRPV